MTEPLTPEREQGIRLWVSASNIEADPQAQMLDELLKGIDSLRSRVQGLETELSVHERRNRISRATTMTQAEENMLRFALDCVQEIYASRPFEFTQGDAEALKSLRDMAGMQ